MSTQPSSVMTCREEPLGEPALPGCARPARQAHLEDGDPGVADVVEVDGPVVRVRVAGAAHVVVLVPVDAGAVAARGFGLRLTVGLPAQRAGHAQLAAAGDVRALLHSVVTAGGADEGVLLALLRLVVGPQEAQVVVSGETVGGSSLSLRPLDL